MEKCAIVQGYHGDTSAMFPVGNVAAADWKMCEVTEAARDAAIAACGPGVPINQIGQVSLSLRDNTSLPTSDVNLIENSGMQFARQLTFFFLDTGFMPTVLISAFTSLARSALHSTVHCRNEHVRMLHVTSADELCSDTLGVI